MSGEFNLRNFVGNLLHLAQNPPPNGVFADAISQFEGVRYVRDPSANSQSSQPQTADTTSGKSRLETVSGGKCLIQWARAKPVRMTLKSSLLLIVYLVVA